MFHDSVESYIAQVAAERRLKGHHLNKEVKLVVDEAFLDELLKYDFTSSKKG